MATVSTLCSVVRKGRLKSQVGTGARAARLTISSRLYFTCTSSAGVASVRHKVEGRVSGRTVHLAQAPSPPSLSLLSVCALFTPSPTTNQPPLCRVWGTEGDGGFVGRRGLEASFGFGVGRQPNRASVGRRTRVPCLRSGSDVPRCSSARAHPPTRRDASVHSSPSTHVAHRPPGTVTARNVAVGSRRPSTSPTRTRTPRATGPQHGVSRDGR